MKLSDFAHTVAIAPLTFFVVDHIDFLVCGHQEEGIVPEQHFLKLFSFPLLKIRWDSIILFVWVTPINIYRIKNIELYCDIG